MKLFKGLRQVKITILGKENVGKTTLVRRIIGDWSVTESLMSVTFGSGTRNPTDGIEMKPWKVKGFGEEDNTIIYFWDFAGQELYYATHHFFLTRNSINVVVFNCTESLEENRLQFWLNSIQAMAPGSDIVLAGSFADRIKTEEEILSISKDISSLIETQWGKLPSNERPKIQQFKWNDHDLPFLPVHCTSVNTKRIQFVHER